MTIYPVVESSTNAVHTYLYVPVEKGGNIAVYVYVHERFLTVRNLSDAERREFRLPKEKKSTAVVVVSATAGCLALGVGYFSGRPRAFAAAMPHGLDTGLTRAASEDGDADPKTSCPAGESCHL